MRPYKEEDIERVRDITRPFLATHGEPVAWGWDGARSIGIKDVGEPDFGDRTEIMPGEVPVFWGCGVTPQIAVEQAGEKVQGIVCAHEPGNMLVTDLTVADLEWIGKRA